MTNDNEMAGLSALFGYNVTEISHMLNDDKKVIVEFNDEGNRFETFPFEMGMKAVITRVAMNNEYVVAGEDAEPYYEVDFDYTEFEEYNKQFESTVWYGAMGDNKLYKFSESVFYPKQDEPRVHTQFFMKDDILPIMFVETIDLNYERAKSASIGTVRLGRGKVSPTFGNIDANEKNVPITIVRIENGWAISAGILSGYNGEGWTSSSRANVYDTYEEAEADFVEAVNAGHVTMTEYSPLAEYLLRK